MNFLVMTSKTPMPSDEVLSILFDKLLVDNHLTMLLLVMYVCAYLL